jgi:rRNA-processing protein FCF1
MDVLLDTNFVLTSMKQKIDFPSLADELFSEPIKWIVPQEVLNELGTLKDKSGTKSEDKAAAQLSFDLIQKINPEIIELGGKNPNVDMKIVNHIMDKPITLATLDKGLKQRVDNKILTIRGKNSLEII